MRDSRRIFRRADGDLIAEKNLQVFQGLHAQHDRNKTRGVFDFLQHGLVGLEMQSPAIILNSEIHAAGLEIDTALDVHGIIGLDQIGSRADYSGNPSIDLLGLGGEIYWMLSAHKDLLSSDLHRSQRPLPFQSKDF